MSLRLVCYSSRVTPEAVCVVVGLVLRAKLLPMRGPSWLPISRASRQLHGSRRPGIPVDDLRGFQFRQRDRVFCG